MGHLLFWLTRRRRGRVTHGADGVQGAERNKALEAVRLQRGTGKPPVAVAGTWPSSKPVAGADRTRPVSWLGPEFFGVHPYTKGTLFFHRWVPGANTVVPEGSPGISRARRQETLRAGRRECRSADRVSGRAAKHLHPPGYTNCRGGTCHCRRRGHAWDAPRVARPCLATAGKRGWGRTCLAGVRKPWERSAACAERLACHRTIRSLRCLYSRDNGCTTKRDRFCRFAGV